ncbi:MAG: hypothetical protein SAJ37_11790 [Oscillatoria sp. PMC 1068.18]|nr:hypothetical protein [Oscillatoria sp. PMC 1076.18]MEC4989422.1 hypothetical protein [Oscillatoria sp. PMC 1068.18]
MKNTKKTTAVLLLTLGAICLLVPMYVLIKPNATDRDRIDAIGGIFVGLPSIVIGRWLSKSLSREKQQQTDECIQTIFYRLLAQNQGKITVMSLAIEANLSATVAKNYLDSKAQEFDADFEVSESGKIYYKFLV